MKRTIAAAAAAIMAALMLAGCAEPSALSAKSPVTVTMWHNYGGDMQKTMDALIDEFNGTAGKELGVIIDVTAISSSAELNESLAMIANGDPGAPELPDIFTGYPKIAVQFQEKGMLANLDAYFTADELSAYIGEFIAEGRLPDGGLYVFPIAKSTEILYLNKTIFSAFAAETGADEQDLSTFEGIARLAREYYDWTDGKTPDVANDGKQFFSSDAWFNVAEVGMVQLGGGIFGADGALALEGEEYAHIFDTLYAPAVEGGFAIYDGYSSDLAKTGDIVCSTGSSAGILFYGDSITYADGAVESVEYDILPYPIFEGGRRIALQRGGGLMVASSDERTERAAAAFIKWLTAAGQNMAFISKTGYLPVTKRAFEEDMQSHLASLEDARIRKMLTAVLSMYDGYEFFTAPNAASFDSVSRGYEQDFKALMVEGRESYLSGGGTDAAAALARLK